MLRVALCLGLCLAASIAPLATSVVHAQRAETTQSIIQRGQSEYDDLRFQEALQTFSAALVRAGNTPADLARIYRYLALTYLALDRREEAEGAYRSLLGLAPDTMPGSDMSPRFREFFTQVVPRMRRPPKMRLNAPTPMPFRRYTRRAMAAARM